MSISLFCSYSINFLLHFVDILVKVKEPAPVEVLPNTTGGVYIPPSKRMGSGVSSNKSRGS